MCNPLALISAGASVVGGIQQKQAADRAAAAALAAGEFNATIIERDIDLLERQRGIINSNFLVGQERAAIAFERDVQGAARAGFGYAGFDMSAGTPIAVLRENAREFDYEQKAREFNNQIQNMQITDAQEEAELNAQLSRMEGGMAAASARAQGTSSMISGFGEAAQFGYEAGLFGEGK
jgi:hypothetical protein